MTNRYDIDIARARASLASLEATIEQHSQGPNLTATGRPKAAVTTGSESRANSEARPARDVGTAARLSLRGPQLTGVPSSGIKSDDHITGTASTYKKTRARDWGADDLTLEADTGVESKGAAITRSPKLWWPISRSIRPCTPEGVTSFHYSSTFVSKVVKDVVTASGARTRAGSAREHSRYLERDGAVAKAPIGELVSLKPAGKDISDVRAREGSDYIERQEALATGADGDLALFTNISDDAEERREFWQLVEKHANKPGADRVTVEPGANPDLWANVRADAQCPDTLRVALDTTVAGDKVEITIASNEDFRGLLKRHGWKPPRKKRDNETSEDYKAEVALHHLQTGATFHDARGGLIQLRMVGELPCEVTHEARLRILRGMAKPFDNLSLPYTAVMHAPDHSNNDKNWHFHLIAHDRPVARFVNDPLSPTHDHLRPCASDNPAKRAKKAKALALIGSTHLEQFVGRWDFDVPLVIKKKSRNSKTSYPFRQGKLRHLPILAASDQRVLLAELTNIELERAGAVRRVDPRRYDEIGIDREPDEHLSTRRAQLEDRGIPTEVGQRNEARQWSYQMRLAERAHAKAIQALEAEVLEMRRALAARKPVQGTAETGASLIRAYECCQHAVIEQHRITRLLSEHHDRAASRAQKVEQVCKRHLAAIEDGKASRQLQRREQDYRNRLDDAQAHLSGLAGLLEDEIAQMKRSRNAAERHEADALRLRAEFEQILERAMPEPAVVTTPQQPTKRTPDPQGPELPQSETELSGDQGNNSATPIRRLLTAAEMEAFVQFVLDQRVRLVIRDRVVVPKVDDPRFAAVVAAANYQDLMPRLRAIHSKQNEARDHLLEGITRDPSLVELRRTQDGRVAVALRTSDRRMQGALRMFIDDPRVAKALRATVAGDVGSNNAVSIAPKGTSRGAADAAPAPGPMPTASKSPPEAADHFDMVAERRRIEAFRLGQLRVQELRRGLHASLDQWLVAKAEGDDAARQAATDAIAGDATARICLKPLSGPDVDALRLDLAATEERALRKEEVERKQREQQLSLQRQRSQDIDWS